MYARSTDGLARLRRAGETSHAQTDVLREREFRYSDAEPCCLDPHALPRDALRFNEAPSDDLLLSSLRVKIVYV